MTALNRRRFLMISAASAAVPTGTCAAPTATWRGTALGAHASMKVSGLSESESASVFAAVEQELVRLEQIFSLYRNDSEITRLNRDGALTSPSPELLDVLTLSASLNRASGGAFDPTVQPLWLARAQDVSGAALKEAQSAVGWQHLEFNSTEVRFHGPAGARALSLNGIAQGAITDRISELLKTHGLYNTLIDMGEISVAGLNDGTPWTVGIAKPDGGIVRRLTLRDRAIATSVPEATMIGSKRQHSHILGPAGELPRRTLVSVSAPTAALADGLSTALCLIDKEQNAALLSAYPKAKIEAEI